MVLAAMALPPWGVGGRAATASAASPPLPPPALPPEAAVLAAYYLWYGNPEFDGDYKHWNHEVLPHWSVASTRGRSLATACLGVQQWPSSVKVAIHLEPYVGRNATTVREDLAHLAARCGAAPALLRLGGRPLFFVYDSYHIQPADWAELLSPGGARTVRGTPLDGVFVGLWLRSGDGDRRLLPSGFDGFYTYFASEAVKTGGGGGGAREIRPWNAAATRGREGGALYRTAWRAALDVAPDGVTITSYNEWRAGVLPRVRACSSRADGSGGQARAYQSYGDRPEDAQLYLDITASCTKQFAAQREERRRQQQRAERERGAGGGRPVDEL
eukprot:scaffold12.g8104.t1